MDYTIAGAITGYGIALLFGFNSFMSVGCGLILGSTTAVTLNILHDNEVDQKEKKANNTDPALNELKDR